MKKYLLIFCFSMMSSIANASLIYNVTGGQLTGIQNIDVNGIDYDVSFIDGTFASVFDSKYDFTSPADNKTALNNLNAALVDNVLINSVNYNFDTSPDLISGCSSPTTCGFLSP